MKNYCTSFELYFVTARGHEFLARRAYSKSTLFKHAKKLGFSFYCIATLHTVDLVSTIVKKDYYHA